MPTAVVTGAGSGLGRAISLHLAERGCRVIATDIDSAAAASTAAEAGRGAISIELDVRDPEACRRAAGLATDGPGSLDIWVNNAGILATGPVWKQHEEARRALIEVNALGTMNGTAAALDAMLAAGQGHVINVVSLAGLVPAPGEVSYSASKHAALGFTLGVLFDLRSAGIGGIDVSAVCPDGIWTPMIEASLDDPEVAASFSGQLLTPERVAAEVGRLLDRPRPLVVIPRWRGPVLRAFAQFPRISLRLLPLVMWDARRRQRRYKKRIKSGRWP